jgi:hypothetical protein
MNAPATAPYDIILADGRVIAPETKLDAVRHVGIRAGKIAAVAEEMVKGRVVMDITGLVVVPGFSEMNGVRRGGNHGSDGDLVVARIGRIGITVWYDSLRGRKLARMWATPRRLSQPRAVHSSNSSAEASGTLSDNPAGIASGGQVEGVHVLGAIDSGLPAVRRRIRSKRSAASP